MAADGSYRSLAYVGRGRMYSFANQIASIIDIQPETVLEIGMGSGFVTDTLRRFGVAVTTADLNGALDPDVVADVRSIPVPDGAFDVVSCCQVLEHIPFTDFLPALVELRRVARRRLVLSLPDVSRQAELMVLIPKLGERRATLSLGVLARTMPADLPGRPNHCWEIGFRGTRLAQVSAVITAAGWHIDRTWRVPEFRWHRFFILS